MLILCVCVCVYTYVYIFICMYIHLDKVSRKFTYLSFFLLIFSIFSFFFLKLEFNLLGYIIPTVDINYKKLITLSIFIYY